MFAYFLKYPCHFRFCQFHIHTCTYTIFVFTIHIHKRRPNNNLSVCVFGFLSECNGNYLRRIYDTTYAIFSFFVLLLTTQWRPNVCNCWMRGRVARRRDTQICTHIHNLFSKVLALRRNEGRETRNTIQLWATRQSPQAHTKQRISHTIEKKSHRYNDGAGTL